MGNNMSGNGDIVDAFLDDVKGLVDETLNVRVPHGPDLVTTRETSGDQGNDVGVRAFLHQTNQNNGTLAAVTLKLSTTE